MVPVTYATVYPRKIRINTIAHTGITTVLLLMTQIKVWQYRDVILGLSDIIFAITISTCLQ